MDGWNPIFLAAIATRTVIVFVFLFLALRVTGKRQFGEMNVHDMLLILVVSNAVQNSMTRQSPHLAPGLVSAGTLLILGWLLGYVTGRFPAGEPALRGEPTVLVENGRVLGRQLREQGVNQDDLMAAVRNRGLAGLEGVRLAVLEANGTISIVPWENKSTG